MPFEEACVCEVFAPGEQGPGSFGSGYLVREDMVLTAGHVVDEAAGPCEVRLLCRSEWLSAEGGVAWRGESTDAALLRIPAQEITASARLGRLAGARRVPCRAVGFPLAQERGRVRDTEEIEGEIAPLTARKEGVLTVHIAGSVPTAGDSGGSPWEGMSGAALFCDGLLVGVLKVDPASFGTDRLTATPITEPAADSSGQRAPRHARERRELRRGPPRQRRPDRRRQPAREPPDGHRAVVHRLDDRSSRPARVERRELGAHLRLRRQHDVVHVPDARGRREQHPPLRHHDRRRRRRATSLVHLQLPS